MGTWGTTAVEVFGEIGRRPVNETPLAMWLRARSISRTAFAKTIGVTKRTVCLWCDNQVLPDLVNAFRIQNATDFGVTPEMWLGTELAKFLWSSKDRQPPTSDQRQARRKHNRKSYQKRKHTDGQGPAAP